MSGLIVDLFAGGGGASIGIERAFGRPVDIAVNHDPEAIALHRRNHPFTRHLIEDVWQVDPLEVTGGRAVDFLWASPDCTHHSKARGGQPVKKTIRGLAWVVCKWAGKVRPRMIMLENVEEFQDWGPVRPKRDATGAILRDEDGRALMISDKARRGQTFRAWRRHLERLGYAVEWRELVAADYGAPTSRKRLLIVARCDGEPIVWPEPTHVPRSLPPAERRGRRLYRRAADIVDWSLPCPSIFMDRAEAQAYCEATGIRIQRPLAEKTMARIARGVVRFVLRNPKPFLVPITHGRDLRGWSADEPLRTGTCANRGEMALIAPYVRSHYGQDGGRDREIAEPVPTVTDRATQTSILAPVLQKYHGERRDGDARGRLPDEPVATVDTQNRIAMLAPVLVPRYGERPGQEPRTLAAGEPYPTVVPTGNGAGVVAAFLAQHNTDMVGHHAEEPVSTIVGKGSTQAVVAANLMRSFGRSDGAPLDDPALTVVGRAKDGLVAAHLMRQFGTATGSDMAEPAPTIMPEGYGKCGVVAAFLQKYYSLGGQDQAADEPLHTVTAKARLALVTVAIGGEAWVLADIGMRMLTPRELYRAQGFPDSYVIDVGVGGEWLSKTAQNRMAGNSVPPCWPEALIRANHPAAARAAA